MVFQLVRRSSQTCVYDLPIGMDWLRARIVLSFRSFGLLVARYRHLV